MKKWEYITEVGNQGHNALARKLNELGKEGWELVAVTPESDDYNPIAYLKREA